MAVPVCPDDHIHAAAASGGFMSMIDFGNILGGFESSDGWILISWPDRAFILTTRTSLLVVQIPIGPEIQSRRGTVVYSYVQEYTIERHK